MDLSHVLAPLFVAILAGIVMGRWRKIGPDAFVSAVMDLFMPALVFDALLTTNISWGGMAASGLASAIVIGLLFLLCLCVPGIPIRNFSLPVLFMNAGFLGMPLIQLAYGKEALGYIVVFDQVQSLFMFTLGIWIAAPRRDGENVMMKSLKAFMSEPLVYSIVIALVLRAAKIETPESILGPIRFLGSVTPALALFTLGLRLSATPLKFFSDRTVVKHLALILALRFAGGFACGLVAISVLGLQGLTRQVVFIASALPAAVFSYILAERYNAEPDLAAAAVMASTVVSLGILPILLHFAA